MPQPSPLPAGLLQRHQSQIARDLLATLKPFRSPDDQHESQRRQRTYPGMRPQSPRLGTFLRFLLDHLTQFGDRRAQSVQQLQQIASPPAVEWNDFWTGFLRFARGMGRKLLIADPLGAFANQVFAADPASLGTGFAWLGLACFTVQIYFDFAGYSDMAIGLARMLGFRLKENFDSPYIAQSLTDFWRRWHISLTTWIRDYLYMPLGGNRRGEARTYINLWICFLASGLWHGANWNFVLWGAYNGLFLTLDRLFLRDALKRCGTAISTAVTLFIVMIGWAIFRSEQPGHVMPFLSALFGMSHASTAMEVPPEVPLTLAIGALISLLPATSLYPALMRAYEKQGWLRALTMAALVLVYVLAIARAVTVPFQPFIYFRF